MLAYEQTLGALQDVLQTPELKEGGRNYNWIYQGIQPNRRNQTFTARVHRFGGSICCAEE